MNTHACSEDQLVEQPAIGLFATLGWQTVSALEETFGAGGTLGRDDRGKVVLADRLRNALVWWTRPSSRAKSTSRVSVMAAPAPASATTA
jgi:hypothetical protein